MHSSKNTNSIQTMIFNHKQQLKMKY